MPRLGEPLGGRCLCGAVSFRLTADFIACGYCHCKGCQRRSGAAFTVGALIPAEGFELLAGADKVRAWQPPGGPPKSFCVECGGPLCSRDPDSSPVLGIRLGTLEGDPGIRPEWHQWVASAPAWDPLPDDGLPRYPKGVADRL
jgi:hypothetical protein